MEAPRWLPLSLLGLLVAGLLLRGAVAAEGAALLGLLAGGVGLLCAASSRTFASKVVPRANTPSLSTMRSDRPKSPSSSRERKRSLASAPMPIRKICTRACCSEPSARIFRDPRYAPFHLWNCSSRKSA